MRAATILLGVALAGITAVAASVSPDAVTLVTTTGKVAAVDEETSEVTVTIAGVATGAATQLHVVVEKDTKITKDGRKIELVDLKPGDVIVVSYRMTGSATVAVNIGVQSKRG